MRSGIGADEEAAVAGRHRAAQGEAMMFALGHRQAIEMRPQAALENRGAIDHQMMRRDRSGHARGVRPDDRSRLLRSDVLDDDLQALMLPQQRQQRVSA